MLSIKEATFGSWRDLKQFAVFIHIIMERKIKLFILDTVKTQYFFIANIALSDFNEIDGNN